MLTLAVVVVIAAAAGFAAFEAHVINVTAHIENALAVDTYGIDFGTVFPQEYVERQFEVGLSASFLAEPRAKDVRYKIVQKDKPWTLNFNDADDDVNTHNRSLLFVDPDHVNSSAVENGTHLVITTDDNDLEDLFGAGEVFGDVTAPRMVIPMGGNFTIETKVTVSPTNYYQAGGILVYGSDGNVVRLEATNWDAFGMGDVVYMESQENQVKVGKRSASLTDTTDVYLKMTRTGDTFKGYYKEDAGDSWQDIPVIEGKTDFDNEYIGDHPKVGLSSVNADPNNHSAFPAYFDYVTFNGDYLSLCRFLSKLPKEGDGDFGVPSYYDVCTGCAESVPDIAYGYLDKENGQHGDIVDGWTVDFKVPPISGYVGQDWPTSCSDWVVEEDEMDYGCDLWIEVIGFSYYQCSDGEDNDNQQGADDHDPDCHVGGNPDNPYCPEWNDESSPCER